MQLRTIKVEKPDGLNIIMGQSHVIRTVDEIHDVLVDTIPGIRFGVAFNESAEPEVIYSGTDESLVELAKRTATNIGADHLFVLLTENAFPVNVMKSLREVSDIAEIYCATDNSVEVIVVETERGCGVMGLANDHGVERLEPEDRSAVAHRLFSRITLKYLKDQLWNRMKLA